MLSRGRHFFVDLVLFYINKGLVTKSLINPGLERMNKVKSGSLCPAPAMFYCI